MRLLGVGSVLAALLLTASACGSGQPAARKTASKLPASLRAYIDSVTSSPRGTVREIDVYGPGTHAAIEQAVMGDIIDDHDPTRDFYAVVLRGRFVRTLPSSPRPMEPMHVTSVESVWSARKGETDTGFGSDPPSATSHLHPLAVITQS
jgi:hypothetical protein